MLNNFKFTENLQLMKKTLFASLIALNITFLAFSQEEYHDQDPKAKVILEELTNKTKEYSTIYAEFDYKMENKQDGIDETQAGKITLKGKEKYKVDIAGQQVICDGKTIWTYIKDADEVQINAVEDFEDEEDNLMNPSNIFTIYEKGFKYKLVSENTENGKEKAVINLYPMKPAEKPYHTITITVNKTDGYLEKAVIKSKDGNVYTYTLKKFEPNKPIPDSDFTFDVSKAGDVIDLRE
ncbi:MAG: outer membrane lipoprotein carrier protein LolA [Bacteroidetes bacterium]|nr:MAG: outer membrane lipoprotein carrier protein LolA [Bacteroidota bacterium]